MRELEWYFDFVSPYAYLQCLALEDLSARVQIVPRPIVLGGIFKAIGQKAPADIEAKRLFIYRHTLWIAQRGGVPFRLPRTHPFNPLKGLRLAAGLGSRYDTVAAIFKHVWAEGRVFEHAEDWALLCEALGARDADSLIAEQSVKDELRENGARAIQAGVFGVPTCVVDGQLFWGYDTTEMLKDYLDHPQRLRGPEFDRAGCLPKGERARA